MHLSDRHYLLHISKAVSSSVILDAGVSLQEEASACESSAGSDLAHHETQERYGPMLGCRGIPFCPRALRS